MYVSTRIVIYPSSHLSFWLTISLFYMSVSVFFCGNMFIGSNLRITCINDTKGYLSFPYDLLKLIWLFLFSSAVLKTALFIFFPRQLLHLVRIPLLRCPFICWWTFCLLACLGYCQYCCSVCLPVCAFSILVFLRYWPIRGSAASYGSSVFTF